MNSPDSEISSKTFQFGVDTQKFLLTLPQDNVFQNITSKISESSIYIGKVCEEINKITSISDLIWKIGIIISNLEICNYKLRILANIITANINTNELERLINESDSLKNSYVALKELNEKKQIEESSPHIIPHVAKISLILSIIFYYIYKETNIYLFIILTIISAIVFSNRITNLLFFWKWDDIVKNRNKD